MREIEKKKVKIGNLSLLGLCLDQGFSEGKGKKEIECIWYFRVIIRITLEINKG